MAKQDWKKRIISNHNCFFMMFLAILSFKIMPEVTGVEKIAGSLVISVPMFLLAWIFHGGIGGGDIKIMFWYGMFLGFDRIVLVFLICTLCSECYIAIKYFGKKSDWNKIPLGTFLAIGIYVTHFI